MQKGAIAQMMGMILPLFARCFGVLAMLLVDGALGAAELEPAVPGAVAAPPGAVGYPSRDPALDVLPGFRQPPPGYGEVPFWWWTGDPLDEGRLIWQIEQLHRKGISGVQVNYAHEDSPGWPTYAVTPPIFSKDWWNIWGRIAAECRQRGMGIGMSTYTLDWTGANNLFRELFYNKTELHAFKLEPLPRFRMVSQQSTNLAVPGDLVAAWALAKEGEQFSGKQIDMMPSVRNGHLTWQAPAGEWEIWLIRSVRQDRTLNPLLAGIGEIVVRDFYQRFQDATPDKSAAGLNYFFNDELQVGAGTHVWNEDFAAEFQKRKGYRLLEMLPALWSDVGPKTPKVRLDYADVRMALMEERYFQPIYHWHASRGLIFACDSGGRGLQPDEFGDYFRATRWYTSPGHDTPGGRADLIKGKVSSSIANLYRRARVWLEGYHSFGWGATPEQLMQATRENYLYGCTLLNLHGLYYSTHGSFLEWAPPCYHFRMPYWDHMDVFLKYFERLSYLLSQGAFVSDVAILYPVAPFEAGMHGDQAAKAAFDTARALMAAGVNFEFIDADSLARARVEDGRLRVADSAYRALVFPSMEAVRWSSLQQAARLRRAGGFVWSVGAVPMASDRAGRQDAELDVLVGEIFPAERRLAGPANVPAQVLAAFVPDVRADPPVRALHRRVGPREVYMVMDAAKNAAVEFRCKGRVEGWDPWTGEARPLRALRETETGTVVELPLEKYEAQIVVFAPQEKHANPPVPAERKWQDIVLEGDWEFELKPTMDNRYGDFRLPVTDQIIGAEARIFRHVVQRGEAVGWEKGDFDDRAWERVTSDFGPQFYVLGPVPADADFASLDKVLAAVTRVIPGQTVEVSGKAISWQPYAMSWRQGREGDPGHQGWHGLKELVTDHFLCLGKRGDAMNEIKYEPELAGGRYYVWTCAMVEQETRGEWRTSAAEENGKPHASAVLKPSAVFLNGQKLQNLSEPVELRRGANPILVRFDQAGRGYFVLRKVGVGVKPGERTPLSMRWFDDPALIRFDVAAGGQEFEWFRFMAPPGLRSMKVTARGQVQAWCGGRPMKALGQGRFEVAEPVEKTSTVALRVKPETGFAGGAVLPEPIRLECGKGRLPLGDWSKTGVLECYSGGAWYRKTVSLSDEQAQGELVLDLGKVVATAEVRVNGEKAGIRVAPPWRVDVSKHMRPGENRIEILVYNTLANHYATVPTRYRGEPVSGLLGPVTLRVGR